MRKWLGTCGIVTLVAIACAALSLISSPAVAQPRTIRVLVPFPPGGSADILARLLGDQIGKAQGVTILTENRPGASVGPATTQHIGIELIKHAANVNLTHIPYTGGAPAINALLGGHVTAVFANYSEVVEQVNAGKLRALVVTSKKRIDPLPAVPTMEELGYKDFEVEVWFGLLAPAKTPKNEIAQLADWFTAAMQVPDVKAKLVAIGLYPVGMCGDAYAAHIRKQFEEYARVMRDAGIKGE